MKHDKVTSHKSFLLSSGAFVALNILSNIFEVGFNAVLVRLPEGDYSTAQTLFRIFFIITAPLASIQLMVGKEISALRALDRYGEAKHFASLSIRYVLLAGMSIMTIGLLASPLIAGFIRIDSVAPVIYTMIVAAFYTPIPVLFGIIQGLKKFALLGLVNISWGGGRFILALVVLTLFSRGLNGIMAAAVGASLLTAFMAILPARDIFKARTEAVSRPEIRRAFSFTLPIMLTLVSIAVLRGMDLILARRFFTEGAADAYSLASTTGAAFFTLSSIFMVMLPTISHEKTLRRNPIRFLQRSLLFTGGLSLMGIAVSWFFPTFVMRVLTVGKIVYGAEPLIQVVGVMVLPLSLSYLIANYFLAQHITGFLPILLGGMALQFTLMLLQHSSPLIMLCMAGAANAAILTGMLIYLKRKNI